MSELRIAIPGLTLAAQVWGEADAPPLLALHGWLDNSASFARLAPMLAERYRVIALDLPGHGHSDHLAAGMAYHYVDYVRATIALADALQLTRFAVLGHSLGAGIASLLAAAVPTRISELFLIEGLGPMADDGARTLQRFRDGLESNTSRPRALRVFPDKDMAIAARVAVAQMDADLVRGIVERSLRDVDGGYSWRSDPRLAEPSPLRLAETQVLSLLLGIEAPTALLLAEPATTYLDSDAMQVRIDCVGDIRTQRLTGGHHLHLEHPENVAAWVLGAPQGVA
jgi:pimeloyl-ACP methyl ester carboxylesterase